MPNLSYIDGNYYDYYESKIHINDRGYHFGDAVYEVILYNQGCFMILMIISIDFLDHYIL
jgi:branched-subunit amino acid aminotransferase/4-amino-4-deoxychorismate lyase